MSYCRINDADSDVYVIHEEGDGLGDIITCFCLPGGTTTYFIVDYDKPEEMIAHLIEHRKCGDKVPERAILRLWNEIRKYNEELTP